jgi:methylated-DNA-[protein]-cysteine S-methyltransferase
MSIESPIGRILLISDKTHLKSVTFSDELVEESTTQPEILVQSAVQLHEYFAGTRTKFELDLAPDGTAFQNMVWNQLLLVPFGSTKSYRDIAVELGSSLNTRAVGTANGKNPISIIVPCHRIIGHDGKLVGYAGGIERKKWLLLHEAKHTQTNLLF